MGLRKRLKCCTHHHFGMDWVCKKSKMGESTLICGPKKQVIYREQQNVLIRSCLKSHNCIIPPLYHLNPFPDLLAPADSIFPVQGTENFLTDPGNVWRSAKLSLLSANKALDSAARLTCTVSGMEKGESPVL